MALQNTVFVDEIKATINDQSFSIALDNFIVEKKFGELAKLTPFYMANRAIIDMVVSKYNMY